VAADCWFPANLNPTQNSTLTSGFLWDLFSFISSFFCDQTRCNAAKVHDARRRQSNEANMQLHDNYEPDRFMREGEVNRRTGLSRTTRWRMEQTGDFPRRRQLSPNSVGWLEREIETWMLARIKAGAA
jgi:prophage regulatory protein